MQDPFRLTEYPVTHCKQIEEFSHMLQDESRTEQS